MNGFNKGLERIYSDRSTPITDATAIRGLRMLRMGLPALPGDPEAMNRAVIGIILVQFARRLSVIHAFAHGYTRRYPVQQGKIHGILAPPVLQYLFDQVDARRQVLAEGFEIDAEGLSDEEVAEAIIYEIVAVRDALDLPTRLREIEVLDNDDFRDTAEYIMNDRILVQGPDGFDPTVEEIEAVLRGAW
jgi:alcohol dehydrogenase class IV